MKSITPIRAGFAGATTIAGISILAMTALQAFPSETGEPSPATLTGDDPASCEIIQAEAGELFGALDFYLETGSTDQSRGFIADAVEDYRPLTADSNGESDSQVLSVVATMNAGVSNIDADRLREGALSEEDEWYSLAEVGIAQEELAYLCAQINGVTIEEEVVSHPLDILTFTLRDIQAQEEWESIYLNPDGTPSE